MIRAAEKFFRTIDPPAHASSAPSIEDRLPAFDGIAPADARARLAAATVTIVGLGSVGRPMAEHLARIGVGTLQLIDRGVIKSQSLLTHAGTFASDIGTPKASNAGMLCRSI